MEFVTSYMLLVQNKQKPTAENIMNLLSAISAPVDKSALDDFMKRVEGKSYEEILSSGAAMMTLQRAAVGQPQASAAEKKEEPEVASDSDSDADIDLF